MLSKTTVTTAEMYAYIDDLTSDVHKQAEDLGCSPVLLWLAVKDRAEYEIQLHKRIEL